MTLQHPSLGPLQKTCEIKPDVACSLLLFFANEKGGLWKGSLEQLTGAEIPCIYLDLPRELRALMNRLPDVPSKNTVWYINTNSIPVLQKVWKKEVQQHAFKVTSSRYLRADSNNAAPVTEFFLPPSSKSLHGVFERAKREGWKSWNVKDSSGSIIFRCDPAKQALLELPKEASGWSEAQIATWVSQRSEMSLRTARRRIQEAGGLDSLKRGLRREPQSASCCINKFDIEDKKSWQVIEKKDDCQGKENLPSSVEPQHPPGASPTWWKASHKPRCLPLLSALNKSGTGFTSEVGCHPELLRHQQLFRANIELDSVIYRYQLPKSYIRNLRSKPHGWKPGKRVGNGKERWWAPLLWYKKNPREQVAATLSVMFDDGDVCDVMIHVHSLGRYVHGGHYPHGSVSIIQVRNLLKELRKAVGCYIFYTSFLCETPYQVDLAIDVPQSPLHLLENLHLVQTRGLHLDAQDTGYLRFAGSKTKERNPFLLVAYDKGQRLCEDKRVFEDGEVFIPDDYKIHWSDPDSGDFVMLNNVLRLELSLFPGRRNCRKRLREAGFRWPGCKPILGDLLDHEAGKKLFLTVLEDFAPSINSASIEQWKEAAAQCRKRNRRCLLRYVDDLQEHGCRRNLVGAGLYDSRKALRYERALVELTGLNPPNAAWGLLAKARKDIAALGGSLEGCD